MTVRVDLSPAHAALRLAGSLQALSGGPGNPGIEIYALPVVAEGNLRPEPLVTIRLQRPAGRIVEGMLMLDPLEPEGDLIGRSGQAAWARFVDGAGAWSMTGEVGLEGSETLVWLASLTLRAGGRCPLVSSVLV